MRFLSRCGPIWSGENTCGYFASPGAWATAGAVANAAEQLLKTCNALGIWAPRHLTGKQVRELRLANTEMDFRIQTLQRTFCWTDEGLAESERSELEKVWHVLRHYGHLEAA